MNKKYSAGISFLELIVAISIIGLLSRVAIAGLSKFKLNQVHNDTTQSVLAFINEARTRAQAGDNARSYSITVDTTTKKLTLFRVTTGPGDTSYSEDLNLNSNTTLAKSITGGDGSTITFTRFTGATSNTGTITITTTLGSNSRSSVVQIFITGLATIQ